MAIKSLHKHLLSDEWATLRYEVRKLGLEVRVVPNRLIAVAVEKTPYVQQ